MISREQLNTLLVYAFYGYACSNNPDIQGLLPFDGDKITMSFLVKYSSELLKLLEEKNEATWSEYQNSCTDLLDNYFVFWWYLFSKFFYLVSRGNRKTLNKKDSLQQPNPKLIFNGWKESVFCPCGGIGRRKGLKILR